VAAAAASSSLRCGSFIRKQAAALYSVPSFLCYCFSFRALDVFALHACLQGSTLRALQQQHQRRRARSQHLSIRFFLLLFYLKTSPFIFLTLLGGG
jgi:hypothetical protein